MKYYSFQYNANFIVTGTTFDNNIAAINGGAIYL